MINLLEIIPSAITKSLPMEIVSKILIMRPVHPCAKIIWKAWRDFNQTWDAHSYHAPWEYEYCWDGEAGMFDTLKTKQGEERPVFHHWCYLNGGDWGDVLGCCCCTKCLCGCDQPDCDICYNEDWNRQQQEDGDY